VDNHCLVSQAIPYDNELRAVGRIPPFNPTYGMGIIRNKNRRVGWRHTTFADLSPVIANPPPIARLDPPLQSHFYWQIEGTIRSLKTLITVPSIPYGRFVAL